MQLAGGRLFICLAIGRWYWNGCVLRTLRSFCKRETLTMFWQVNLLSKLLLNCVRYLPNWLAIVAVAQQRCLPLCRSSALKRVSLPFPLLLLFCFFVFLFFRWTVIQLSISLPTDRHVLQHSRLARLGPLRKLTLHWTSIEIARFLLLLGMGVAGAAAAAAGARGSCKRCCICNAPTWKFKR